MSSKRRKKPWFTHDAKQAMLATLALGLERWVEDAAPAGLNKYFWPGRPGGDHTILSSCSGVPLTPRAHQACLDMFSEIVGMSTPLRAHAFLRDLREWIVQGLRDVLNLPSETPIFLTQSVPEAYRLATLVLSFEAGSQPVTAILPASGMDPDLLPAAVRRCFLDGAEPGTQAAIKERVEVVQIPLRGADGHLLPDIQLLEAFHREAERAASEPFVYGALGDGTGTVAPLCCPPPARMVLDASQMRLRPERIADHLGRGWPLVISGSGFLGSPGATGALVLSAGRFPQHMIARLMSAQGFYFADGWDPDMGPLPHSGCLLRWLPALHNLRDMTALGTKAEVRIARMTCALTSFLAEFPDIEVLPGRTYQHVAICGRDSGIVTFAVRDSARPGQWLAMPELIALYHDLAGAGVLLGHPIMAGGRAALRVAVSAEDVLRGEIEAGLARLGDALTRADGLRQFVRRRRGPPAGHGPRSVAPGAAAKLSRRAGSQLYC